MEHYSVNQVSEEIDLESYDSLMRHLKQTGDIFINSQPSAINYILKYRAMARFANLLDKTLKRSIGKKKETLERVLTDALKERLVKYSDGEYRPITDIRQ